MTAFKLTRSKDRKVANAVSPNGKTATIANTFGLPSGQGYSCPDATAFCETICYAGKLEKVYKGVSAVLIRNWDLLRDASRADMVALLGDMVAEFIRDCDKRDAPKLFRIHWDGDFFSPVYTVAWAQVIRDNPDVRFWAYTRVATAAVYLHAQRLENLALYFSADPDNVAVARHLEATKGIRIAYVDTDFAKGKQALPNAVRCPENNRALPLISEQGSACTRCALCIRGERNVLFSTTKK
jgi:Gene product 88